MFRKLLLAIACFVPSAAGAEWHEASSKHFVVYSEGDEKEIRGFTERLERFDKAMRAVMAVPDRPVAAASRVTVYVVDRISDVQELAGKRMGNVAGFYQARRTGPIAFVPRRGSGNSIYALDAQTILYHEYAHHFMYSSWGGTAFPMWFSEGFAEFVATVIFRPDGRIVFGAQPLHRIGGILGSNTMPARKMLLPNPGKMSGDERGVLYSRAWLLTHYLIFDKSRTGQLPAYISALNGGKSGEEAMAIFGDPTKLDFNLDAYVKRSQVPAITLTPQQVPIATVTVRPLTPGEAATMPARIRSQNGVDKASAPAVLEMARRAAAPYPNDAGAQNELAEAEYDVGNLVEADAAAHFAASEAASDRVLAVDPKSVHALLYKGMAMQALAEKAGTTDPARWQAIRRWYIAANKVDPEYPEPLVLFYESFAAARQAPSANAQSGLLYAAALAPFDLGLRMNAATVLLHQGKADEARAALRSIAYAPHGGASEIAAKMLTALDSGGTAAALATMKAGQAKPGDAPTSDKDKSGKDK